MHTYINREWLVDIAGTLEACLWPCVISVMLSSYTSSVHAPTDKELWSIPTNLSKATQLPVHYVLWFWDFFYKKPWNMFLERKQWLYLLLLPGTELSLIAESFGLLNDLPLPFPSILDASCPIFDLHLANVLLMLSSYPYLGLPCDLLVRGFQLSIFWTVLVSDILCTWPNQLSLWAFI